MRQSAPSSASSLARPGSDSVASVLKPTRYTTPASLSHLPLSILRCFLAFLLSLLLAPITAPALVLRLPPCLPVRLLQRIAVCALSVVAKVAAVEVTLSPRSQSCNILPWLPAPLIKMWTSPLPRGRFVRTYDQPGRWMTDSQLSQLQSTLKQVAASSIGCVPTHRLFSPDAARDVFTNRIISVAFDSEGPLGFTAMVYLDCPMDVVVHLGLTMMGKRGKGQRLQSALFTKSLFVPVINLCRTRFYITNCAASPAGIGNVCDYFFDCFPTYLYDVVKQEHHVQIASYVLKHYRHEFGCSQQAHVDLRRFVVYKSNAEHGGGTHEFIKEDGSPVSRHRDPRCNEFVRKIIDFRQGDEVFQVATFNMLGSAFKYLWTKLKARRFAHKK